MAGKLYLIATPIGNLKDITYRAVEILKEVDVIAAEDTRHSLKLLNYLEISKPMISYHRHNEDTKTTELIKILQEGKSIGLITDAGTPGISDPGEEVVKEAIKEQIEVIPIPGACALINALIASGLGTKEFTFYGFLPLDKKLRNEKFEDIQKQNKTIIFYEAPHRLIKTLQEMEQRLGNIEVVLAKELTKIHEKFIRGTIEKVLETLEDVKGEYIILFENHAKTEKQIEIENINQLRIEEQLEIKTKKASTFSSTPLDGYLSDVFLHFIASSTASSQLI